MSEAISAAPPLQKVPKVGGLPHADGDVLIEANAQTVGGWTDVSISGGLEMMPAVFDLGMTETSPGQLKAIILQSGDACTIKIGGDLVLTGYINRVVRGFSTNSHTIRVQGRSRCQDLVDCSATPDSLSINNPSIGAVARDLVAKFAGPITVLTPDGDGAHLVYSLGIDWGETPWEIISQIATYEGLLVHDDAKGDLVICKVGTTKMASGFAEGANVQEASVAAADDMLFSVYIPLLNAQDSLKQIGPGGNSAGNAVPDPLVKRFRPMVVVSDQPLQGQTLAQQRAVWEATRRRGRALTAHVTADSWRDSAGTLWTHNMLAPLNLPRLQVTKVEWIIATWAFSRDPRSGTIARLTLMAPEAFSVQPTVLGNQNRQIAQANAEHDAAVLAMGGSVPRGDN